MKTFKSVAASIIVALASLDAHALTIDFEATGTHGYYNNLDYPISGFVFNYAMDNIDISPASPWSPTGPAHSGSFAALNNHGGAGEVALSGGGTFSFENLWLRSWYGSASAATVTGLLNGVQVGSVSGSIGSGWTNFTGNFSQIDTLRIGTNGYFLVDDITLNSPAAPVPEPETYAMMLAGLGMVGFLARRRRKG